MEGRKEGRKEGKKERKRKKEREKERERERERKRERKEQKTGGKFFLNTWPSLAVQWEKKKYLALLSGLRIQHCHKVHHRPQMQLRSGVAVALA